MVMILALIPAAQLTHSGQHPAALPHTSLFSPRQTDTHYTERDYDFGPVGLYMSNFIAEPAISSVATLYLH